MSSINSRSLIITFFTCICLVCGCESRKSVPETGGSPFFDREALHAQAVEESLIPVRPGIPGKSPFWNVNSSRFIYAPAFDFKPVEGVSIYRFRAASEADGKEYVFEAEVPWAPLAPVWKELPVGYVELEVEALDPAGNVIEATGNRRFYRAAAFNGPYGEPVRSYRECAHLGLKFLFNHQMLRNWISQGRPDPRYSLYCYPSKMISRVITGMLLYAEIAPEDKEEALLIARNAARYLIDASEPTGSPLEFFPPTYDSTHIDTTILYENDYDWEWANITARKFDGQIMLTYAASVARAYLDLFDETGDSTLLQAAVKIAGTYAKIQLPDGNWHLKLYIANGEPVVDNHAWLAAIVPLFERLRDDCGMDEYQPVIELAQPHLEARAESFNFEGQFEDIEPSRAYMNLTHIAAIQIARKLLDSAAENQENAAKAEELLRFAEDQFVVWERSIPIPRPDRDHTSGDWITPCALEQYECYRPVDASAAHFIAIFQKAYEVTGKKIYLAKAVSLANTMTRVQDPETGYLPTWWGDSTLDKFGWINCSIYDAQVIREFGKFMEESGI